MHLSYFRLHCFSVNVNNFSYIDLLHTLKINVYFVLCVIVYAKFHDAIK